MGAGGRAAGARRRWPGTGRPPPRPGPRPPRRGRSRAGPPAPPARGPGAAGRPAPSRPRRSARGRGRRRGRPGPAPPAGRRAPPAPSRRPGAASSLPRPPPPPAAAPPPPRPRPARPGTSRGAPRPARGTAPPARPARPPAPTPPPGRPGCSPSTPGRAARTPAPRACAPGWRSRQWRAAPPPPARRRASPRSGAQASAGAGPPRPARHPPRRAIHGADSRSSRRPVWHLRIHRSIPFARDWTTGPSPPHDASRAVVTIPPLALLRVRVVFRQPRWGGRAGARPARAPAARPVENWRYRSRALPWPRYGATTRAAHVERVAGDGGAGAGLGAGPGGLLGGARAPAPGLRRRRPSPTRRTTCPTAAPPARAAGASAWTRAAGTPRTGVVEDHAFQARWLQAVRRALKPSGTLWVSGTQHVIFSIGFAMQELGFHLLNTVTWYKPNASPNLACRFFTHSTEILLWASPQKSRPLAHRFNYREMKAAATAASRCATCGRSASAAEPGGEQVVWSIPTPGPREKTHGRHPTQKPLALLERVLAASSQPRRPGPRSLLRLRHHRRRRPPRRLPLPRHGARPGLRRAGRPAPPRRRRQGRLAPSGYRAPAGIPPRYVRSVAKLPR